MNIKLEKAGEGEYGKVFRTELPYINDIGEVEHASFCATKEFKDVRGVETAEDFAERSVNNYELIKKAGLKIKTSTGHDDAGLLLYRISPDRKKIVMSDLELNGWEVINKADKEAEKNIKEKIEIKIEKWSKLVNELIEEAKKASEKEITLHDDCFTFLKREGRIDFIIGDFDNIKDFKGLDKSKGAILNLNLYAARRSLFIFANENIVNHRECKDYLDSVFKK